MVYPYSEVVFSSKKEALTHVTTQMKLENIVLSERTQSQKASLLMAVLQCSQRVLEKGVKQANLLAHKTSETFSATWGYEAKGQDACGRIIF